MPLVKFGNYKIELNSSFMDLFKKFLNNFNGSNSSGFVFSAEFSPQLWKILLFAILFILGIFVFFSFILWYGMVIIQDTFSSLGAQIESLKTEIATLHEMKRSLENNLLSNLENNTPIIKTVEKSMAEIMRSEKAAIIRLETLAQRFKNLEVAVLDYQKLLDELCHKIPTVETPNENTSSQISFFNNVFKHMGTALAILPTLFKSLANLVYTSDKAAENLSSQTLNNLSKAIAYSILAILF